MKSLFRSIGLRRQEARNPIAGSPHGMIYYPKSYENFAACPADLDIASYLEEREGGLKIFHFGTGRHHHVGLSNHKRIRPNVIIAITASPQEYLRYIELCVRDGSLGRNYLVYFGDIYNLRSEYLPRLDIVSLPHLGEYHDPTKALEADIIPPGVKPDRSRYAPLDDRSLLDLVVGKLVPGGRLLIYTGSHGAEVTRQLLLEEISHKQRLTYDTTHGSIAVYAKVN